MPEVDDAGEVNDAVDLRYCQLMLTMLLTYGIVNLTMLLTYGIVNVLSTSGRGGDVGIARLCHPRLALRSQLPPSSSLLLSSLELSDTKVYKP